MIASIVDTHAILQVIWVSLIAGVGVPSCFGLALLGTVRSVEFGRNGRPAEAAVFAIIGFLGLAVVLGSIVFGILTIVND
jgi:hypothetical protein